MTKEQRYIAQLKEMGIWEEAFRGAVHDLVVLEHEQSRTRKAWKQSAEDGEKPSMLDEHYALILQQGRDIARLRDALGFTPKAIRRIKTARDEAFRPGQQVADDAKAAEAEQEAAQAEKSATVLDFVLAKYGT